MSMSDAPKIEPALSAEEWKTKRLTTFSDSDRVIAEMPEHAPKLIALANAALPDDDPRKIRREWIESLRDYGGSIPEPGSWGDEHDEEAKRILYGIADALASYLPPEP